MPAAWKPDSWRAKPIVQVPSYPDQAVLEAVEADLRNFPPLVFVKEVQALKEQLQTLGFDAAQVDSWEKGEAMEDWSPRVPAILWWADVALWLEDQDGPAAADKLRQEIKDGNASRTVEATPHQALGRCGILSLVVRVRYSWQAWPRTAPRWRSTWALLGCAKW